MTKLTFPLLLVTVFVLVIYRISTIEISQLPLFYDEAYYYFWSLTPDWGYFSKPPVVAWLIGLTSSLMPLSALGVKLASPLLYGATALIVYRLGRRSFSPRIGVIAGLLFITMPLVGFNSLFITTDAPLLFCWAMTLWYLLLARSSNSWHDWLLTGVFAGLGMMSKYTMILFPFCYLLYLVSTPSQRPQLINLKLWFGVLVAIIIFLPNVWWNAQHDFISFQHTREISQLERSLFHVDHMLEFVAGQFVAFGLITMMGYLIVIGNRTSYQHQGLRLFIFLSLPYLAIFTVLALLSRANLNWAAPVYVTASLVAAVFIDKHRHHWLPATLGLNLLLMVAFYHYHRVLPLVGVEPSRKTDPYHRVLGWPELGIQLSKFRKQYPNAMLLSGSRKLLAYLGFYTKPPFQQQVAAWNPEQIVRNHYALKASLTEANHGEYLFVSEKPLPADILQSFHFSKLVGTEQITIYQDLTRQVFVYYMKGFKGYEFPSQ